MEEKNLVYKLCENKFNQFNPLESILLNRGISKDLIGEFINPQGILVESENKFCNMSIAKDIFMKTINNKNEIAILYDCDVDGYTSASIMYQVCAELGVIPKIIVHNGKEHGLDKASMERVFEIKPKLLIIPDASSNDFEQINTLLMNGVDIIILDHHEREIVEISEIFKPSNDNSTYFEILNVGENISNRCVIINNQIDNVEDKAMTGVGIVYKFVKYLENNGCSTIKADDYLDLVALGMIADLCDLSQLQSRYYVNEGIKKITNKHNKNLLIKFIYDKISYTICGMLDITSIGYNIAPLLNALIRFGTYEEKYMLAEAISNVEKDFEKKLKKISYSEYIYDVCLKCQKIQKDTIAKEIVNIDNQIKQFNLNRFPILVCNGGNMDKNILGLMAIKISSKYNKSTILLRKLDDNKLSGSARGYNTSSFKDICENTNLIEKCAGHGNAFGVIMDKSKINALYNQISAIELEAYCHEIEYEYSANDSQLNLNSIISIGQYSYLWGCGVEPPKFLISGISLNAKNVIIKGKNFDTITFSANGLDYIKFNCSQEETKIFSEANDNFGEPTHLVDAIVTFNENKFNGNISYKINIIDWIIEEVPF